MKLVLNPKSRARLTLALTLTALACAPVVACSDDPSDPDGNGGEGGEGGSASGGSSTGGRASGGGPSTGGNDGTGAFGGEGGLGGGSGGDASGGTGTGGEAPIPELTVSTIEDLADKSYPDYGDNEHGLITGGRLKRWISNWEEEKPADVAGRLIILQIVPATVTSSVHITPKEKDGVFTYLVNANDFNVARDNGLSSFETDIPDGASVDAWLHKYGIDPRNDLIVLTFEQQGSTANSIVQSVGRAWIYFKYWGLQNEHLAILNGSLNWNATNYGIGISTVAQQKFSKAPNNGTIGVRHLGYDNTVQSISLEEIIAILNEDEGAPDKAGVRIVDARGGAEAYGLKKSTSTGRTTCTSYTGTGNNAKCSTPFEGRIKGAKSVPWTQFLDTAQNGFRFLPYSTVKTTFDTQSGWDSNADFTIQYCRTNQRSTVTGIVANVILGYPTRFYETSFIEWGHVSAGPDGGTTPNKAVVAADFAFRTDVEELTEHAVLADADTAAYTPGGTLGTLTQPVTWVSGPNYNEEADISPPVSGTWPKLNPAATTTRLSIDTDRAYLRDIPIEELDD